MLYVFTSCALNFVPCAKLLAESVRLQMPDARFVLALTDERPEGLDLTAEGFDEVFYLDDFADALGNPRGWAFGHTVMELATAIKPFTACKLMERPDCEAVMFFDPDCFLFGPMTEMRRALESYSVVLTPHASQLHENSRWIFFERNPLKVGAFNLGFIGLRNNETGRRVASWWRFRLHDYCLIEPEQGLFTDQKWFDLLPSYIDDFKVMREPVYNIARWNTFQRSLTRHDDIVFADGEPVQFIHFSGFYKIGAYVQGLYDRSSEPFISNIELLKELSLWYSAELDRVRTQPIYTAQWRLGIYQNGEPIPDVDRRRYKASAELQARFPDPFATTLLSSFWLYCRQMEHVEQEAKVIKQEPLFNLVNRNVQAHNTLLRLQIDALEQQLRQTTSEMLATREENERLRASGDRFHAEILRAVASVSAERIEHAFADVVTDGRFEAAAYLSANPDVAASGMPAIVHFIRYGVSEGRMAPGLMPILFFEQFLGRFLGLLLPEQTLAPAVVSTKPQPADPSTDAQGLWQTERLVSDG